MLAAVAVVVAIVACNRDNPTALSRRPLAGQPVYLTDGNTKRLRLRTPEAQASMLYKDPIQGVMDATGQCRFHDLGKMRIGLMAAVGEWNTETCAGLLFYFRNQTTRPQKLRDETTFVAPPRSRRLAAPRRPSHLHAILRTSREEETAQLTGGRHHLPQCGPGDPSERCVPRTMSSRSSVQPWS